MTEKLIYVEYREKYCKNCKKCRGDEAGPISNILNKDIVACATVRNAMSITQHFDKVK